MLESLDVRTLIVILVLGHAVAALLLFFDTQKRAQLFDVLFMASMALQSAAWALIYLRETAPDVLSFSLGNSIILVGFCIEGICLLSLERLVKRHWRQFYASVLIILLVFWWIPGLSHYIRLGIASFIVPFFFGFPALFLISTESRSTPLRKFLGGTILIYIFATVFRGAFILMAESYSLTIPHPYQILFMLTQVAFMVLASTGYILLRKECICENLQRDIERRKQVEDSLRKSEELHRLLVENAGDVIWAMAPSGRFTYVSKSVEKIRGYTAAEVLQQSFEETLAPASQEIARRELNTRLDEVRKGLRFSPYIGELEQTCKDGSTVWTEVVTSGIYNEKEEFIAILGISRDITERRLIEEALRKANRQLTLLSGITRHDILNQVTALGMYLAIIREDMKDPSMTTFIEKIQSITNTIQAQIAFTRVYQDIGSQEPQWHDLEAVIRKLEVPGAVAMDADVKGIEIFSDPMFEKVFFALLDNSIRHGEHVTQITISSIESEKGLTVVWEDNGIGIQPGEKKNIFKRGVGKNTGFGLFLVSEILALTGITIQENGEPGKGARFEMQVPKGAWRKAGTATR